MKRIPRAENIQANTLAGITVTLPIKEIVLLPMHLQTTSSIVVTPTCNTNETSVDWMHEIENYLWTGNLPEKKEEQTRA